MGSFGHGMRRAAAGAAGAGSIIDLPNLEWFPNVDESYTDAGITPAVDGDDVYHVDDDGPNGLELLQTISAQRPTYETDDGYGVLRFDGANIMTAGDVLDGVIAGTSKKWSMSFSVDNFSVSTTVVLIAKYAPSSNARQVRMRIVNGELSFLWLQTGGGARTIRSTVPITADKHVVTFVYDASIDTNDGLDRVTMRVDGVVVASYMASQSGPLPDIVGTIAPLTVGGFYLTAPATTPTYSAPYDCRKIVVLSDPTESDLDIVDNELMADMGI